MTSDKGLTAGIKPPDIVVLSDVTVALPYCSVVYVNKNLKLL